MKPRRNQPRNRAQLSLLPEPQRRPSAVNGWTDEDAARFIEKAKSMFPGSYEPGQRR